MKAIVFGAHGQQGSLLCEFLLSNNYEVFGIVRRNDGNEIPGVNYFECELTERGIISEIIAVTKPDEIYNLAAMNDVALSFKVPKMTMDVNCGGFISIADAVLANKIDCKIYHACSSEMYGDPVESPQTETTPFNPRSPYGVSKVAGFHMAKVYREKYGMKVYCGIIFNNESPRRPEVFLSRKVCQYVASIYVNATTEKLKLGNLEARRDFGYAKEYVEWTWRIMQHETPDDFVLATGITHSVGEFVQTAFRYIGIDNWRDYIHVDQSLYRPSEGKLLVGDASKSKRLLSFSPKTTFEELISIMMEHELAQYDK